MTEIKQYVGPPREIVDGKCPFCGAKLLKHCALKLCDWLACRDGQCKAFGPPEGMVRL